MGRAASAEFQAWTLTAQRLDSEDASITLAGGDSPVEAGVLARWDTTELPPGLYVLQLTVIDQFLGSIEYTIRIGLPPQEEAPAVSSDAGDEAVADEPN